MIPSLSLVHFTSYPLTLTHRARSYLNGSGVTIPPLSMFNSAGRAYPDVAALGINYQVLISTDFIVLGFGRWTLYLSARVDAFIA